MLRNVPRISIIIITLYIFIVGVSIYYSGAEATTAQYTATTERLTKTFETATTTYPYANAETEEINEDNAPVITPVITTDPALSESHKRLLSQILDIQNSTLLLLQSNFGERGSSTYTEIDMDRFLKIVYGSNERTNDRVRDSVRDVTDGGAFTNPSLTNLTAAGLTTFNDPLTLAQVAAPAISTDKLYNLAGDLYWAGNPVASTAIGQWASDGSNVWRAGGNVGIGTSTPNHRLDIVGGSVNVSVANQDDRSTGFRVAGTNNSGFVMSNFGNSSNLFIGNVIGANSAGSLGYFNTIVGLDTGANIASAPDGYANSFFGRWAGRDTSTGFANTFLGNNAGLQNTTGNNNVAIGGAAGYTLTTGNANILIGSAAGQTFSSAITGSNNIVIGNNIRLQSGTSSDQLNIQNIIFGIANSGSGTTVSTGSIGIGTTTPQTKLQVNGVIAPALDNTYTLGNSTYRFSEVYAANGVINTSDIRLKNDPQDLTYGLDIILALEPISYTWVDQPTQGTRFGLSAQHVRDLIPEIVAEGTDPDRTLGIRYTELIPIIINAIQELADKVAKLAEGVFENDIHAGRDLRADGRLCLEDLCITRDDLAAILEGQAGQGSTPSPTPEPTPEEDATTPDEEATEPDIVSPDEPELQAEAEPAGEPLPDESEALDVEEPTAPPAQANDEPTDA